MLLYMRKTDIYACVYTKSGSLKILIISANVHVDLACVNILIIVKFIIYFPPK